MTRTDPGERPGAPAGGTPGWRGDPALDALTLQRLVDPSTTPTEEQVRIVEAPTRPLLVVAGAGSGKTETMSMRVLWLVANRGIPPESVLGLTFTRKAAGELGGRLRRRLEALGRAVPALVGQGEPVSLTYNAFAERIVAEHGLRIGIDPDFRLLGQARAVQMMSDIVTSWRGDLPEDMNPTTVVAAALELAGHLAEHDTDVERGREDLLAFGQGLRTLGEPTGSVLKVLRVNDRRIALLDLVAAFEARKREEGYLDFSDQLVLATRIVRRAPEVRDLLRADHAAVLLDEFQDTSVIQMELLSCLFADHPVTAVGDPNQAIYGWRGASSASLETFLQRFQSTPPESSQTLTLSTAWRNDRRILDTANVVAEPLRAHAVNARSPLLRPREGAGAGRVDVAFTLERASQMDAIVEFIRSARAVVDPAGPGSGRGRAAVPSAAVLCRRRRDFRDVDAALRGAGIPTQVIGLGGLLDQPAVADVRAALELGLDVRNSPWVVRLVSGLDLGAADWEVLWQWARHLAGRDSALVHPESLLLDAVDSPPPTSWRARPGEPQLTGAARRRLEVLSRRLRAVRAGAGRGVVEQVERAIAVMGVAQDALADPLHNSGREALDAFVDVASDFEDDAPEATMRGFLAWLAVAEEEENGLAGPSAEPDPDAVQVMTIHGAKGLEWDAVAIASLEDKVFPKHDARQSVTWRTPAPGASGWTTQVRELPHSIRGDKDWLPAFEPDTKLSDKGEVASVNKWLDGPYRVALGAHRELEERRLAYVALTRARHRMLLAGSWMDFATQPRDPSRYLMEPLHAGCTDADPDTAIAPRPDDEQVAALVAARTPATFPTARGRSRELVTDSAERVEALLTVARADPVGLLASLDAGETMVSDVVALLEERRLRQEAAHQVVTSDRLPATSVARLLEDPGAFALDLRRPLPEEPTESSALGTLFHAWAERQLRMTSGELWEEPLAGEDSLTERDRTRLAAMRENFRGLDLLTQTPVAVEEPFEVPAGGVSVQGRIDAVFRDRQGRDTVVDWKSGRTPSGRTSPADLRYFLTQLRLYRMAWSVRTGVAEEGIGARVVFLAGPRSFTIADLADMLGEDPEAPLGGPVARALGGL